MTQTVKNLGLATRNSKDELLSTERFQELCAFMQVGREEWDAKVQEQINEQKRVVLTQETTTVSVEPTKEEELIIPTFLKRDAIAEIAMEETAIDTTFIDIANTASRKAKEERILKSIQVEAQIREDLAKDRAYRKAAKKKATTKRIINTMLRELLG